MRRVSVAARQLRAFLLREVPVGFGRHRQTVPVLALLLLLLGMAAVVAALRKDFWGGRADPGPPRDGVSEQEGVGQLAVRLRSADPDERFAARLALMGRGEEALPPLLKALRDADPETRYEAAAALAGLALRVRIGEAVPSLIEALDDSDPRVRDNAIAALRNAGPRAKEAVPRLREALHDPDRAVRENAAWTLQRLDGEQATRDARPPR